MYNEKFQGWILILFLILAATTETQAGDYHYYKDNIEIDVISDERGRLREYQAGAGRKKTERRYIEAKNGERYLIRIRNQTDKRVGLVIAVDGRNIISGKKSYLRNSERMYVVGPWQSSEFEGWRSGKNRVNRFYFTDATDSYADAWDDHTALGVIAAAVYKDRQRRHHYRNESKQRSQIAPESRSQGDDEPGTGFGEEAWSPSRRVHFKPSRHPVYKKFIKYEWRRSLCRRGILNCRHRNNDNRFWPDDDHRDGEYAPYPRWLKRHKY